MKTCEHVIVEANGMDTLHAIIRNRIWDKTYVEARVHALRNLVDLSNELAKEKNVSFELSSNNHSTQVKYHNETNMKLHEAGESLQGRSM